MLNIVFVVGACFRWKRTQSHAERPGKFNDCRKVDFIDTLRKHVRNVKDAIMSPVQTVIVNTVFTILGRLLANSTMTVSM